MCRPRRKLRRLLLQPRGGPRIAPAGGAWILTEPVGDKDIGDEFVLPAGAVQLGQKALVTVEGSVVTMELLPKGTDIAKWAIARKYQLCDDPRILPPQVKPRSFRDAVDLMETVSSRSAVSLPDSPLNGPFVGPDWVQAQVDAGVQSLVSRSEGWCKNSGVRKGAPVTHEHLVLHRGLQLMATIDGYNLKTSVGAEWLLRRVQLHENVIEENPGNPNYEGSDEFMGIAERSGGGYVVPALVKHVADELGRKAAILKEKRKAREAKTPPATGSQKEKKPPG